MAGQYAGLVQPSGGAMTINASADRKAVLTAAAGRLDILLGKLDEVIEDLKKERDAFLASTAAAD